MASSYSRDTWTVFKFRSTEITFPPPGAGERNPPQREWLHNDIDVVMNFNEPPPLPGFRRNSFLIVSVFAGGSPTSKKIRRVFCVTKVARRLPRRKLSCSAPSRTREFKKIANRFQGRGKRKKRRAFEGGWMWHNEVMVLLKLYSARETTLRFPTLNNNVKLNLSPADEKIGTGGVEEGRSNGGSCLGLSSS